jgi:release factor glutamine methyltransferase
MFLVRPPGMYRVDTDTFLLIDVLREGGYAAGSRVLDIGTGTGALALAAARAGAASVTAVDLSLRSVAAAWLNGRLHRIPCTMHPRGLVRTRGGPARPGWRVAAGSLRRLR